MFIPHQFIPHRIITFRKIVATFSWSGEFSHKIDEIRNTISKYYSKFSGPRIYFSRSIRGISIHPPIHFHGRTHSLD